MQATESDRGRRIIAPAFRRSVPALLFWIVFLCSTVVGTVAAAFYARRGLTLSHYDARAHLVVARRVLDSLTPGWRQIGAVWLPLPHLINLLPVQIDWAYRTGYVAVGISIASLGAGLGSIAVTIARRTGSVAAALATPAVVLLNPDVLYLQSTPMSEPLLFGLALMSVAAVDAWMAWPSPRLARRASWILAALVLTRYEGWCIGAALMAIAAVGMWKQGWRRAFALFPAPLLSIAAFLVLGWAATGSWFTSSGFFVPDNPAFHRPLAVLTDLASSTMSLGGSGLVAVGVAGAIVCLAAGCRVPRLALPLALLAAAALPAFAFYEGHPHRIRYMVPLVVAAGVLASLAIAALPRKVHALAAALFVVTTIWQRQPFDPGAPMVLEAQWETPFRLGRQTVTRYLAREYDHTPIMASMGSLGHYMQETSAIGLHIANFLHEGNGDLWAAALERPATRVHWILIEEQAEGGDALAVRARANPAFLAGFAQVAEGGGLVLFRNDAPASEAH